MLKKLAAQAAKQGNMLNIFEYVPVLRAGVLRAGAMKKQVVGLTVCEYILGYKFINILTNYNVGGVSHSRFGNEEIGWWISLVRLGKQCLAWAHMLHHMHVV